MTTVCRMWDFEARRPALFFTIECVTLDKDLYLFIRIMVSASLRMLRLGFCFFLEYDSLFR